MVDTAEPDPFDAIVDAPFDSALSERYLVYALSTITARSLPDLRDGLKPVHRRLLWAMRQLKLNPTDAFKKSARVVGDVIGKYHPHGDQSVYDAMVRLAQDFSLRYPLVEGQGNFGNIDGDNAAAYRYTEARLTKTAIQLMAGLDEGTVNFIPTYNGEEEEPEIFPGIFPNLLANGSTGIAVGMATSIPSHNVAEIIDATLLLIDNPNVEHAELMQVFKGPDFATGGVAIDSPAAISHAYETGKGAIRVRARFSIGRDEAGEWEESGIEKLGGGQWQLVVSEIPYMVQKGKLIEQIATLIADKKLPILEDIRDESDEAIRIVFVPKSRNVDPELLKEWVIAQIDILLRRSQHRLDKIAARLELLEGYIIAFLNLDRIIEIIRTEDEPKPVMMAEFGLTDRQAEAILNMRLRSLRRLEEMELRKEHAELVKEQGELQELLASPAKQRTRLKRDLKTLRKDYAEDTALGRRRTTIAEATARAEFSMDAMIEKAPVTVILSAKGWIRGASGHEPEGKEFKFKEGDGPAFALHAQTTDKLLIACDNGRFYTIGADKLPSARGFGEPIRTMVDIDAEAQIVTVIVYKPKVQLLLASNNGRGFAAEADELLAETRKGRGVMNTKPGVKLAIVREIPPEHDHLAVVGDNRKLLIFSLEELPILAKGQGVTLQRYRDGGLSDAVTLKLDEGLSWKMGGDSGRTRTEPDMRQWKVARGAAGRLPPNGFPRDNRF
jgi:topoisomerase-4 subunit A